MGSRVHGCVGVGRNTLGRLVGREKGLFCFRGDDDAWWGPNYLLASVGSSVPEQRSASAVACGTRFVMHTPLPT